MTIVTAVLNGAGTMENCLQSVADQSCDDIEHVVVDGGSTDGTVDLLRGWGDGRLRWISEPDDGLYEALNKGISLARGDVLGVLGSDDLYADDHAVGRTVAALERTGADSCYGDLVYVDPVNVGQVKRYWRASPYRQGNFRRGWMPPHPTFFARRKLYERYGGFDTRFRISADYELMLRLLERHQVSVCYVPRVQVKMRTGGVSNRDLRSLWNRTVEDYRACLENGIAGGPHIVLLKKLRKIGQYLG
ncbi:MAG: glycosyltransferase family 2 protein [Planctomycetota bacterium]|nr:glycosyltransferase family 2 protein [Planctomycetota bacterium]